MGRIQGHGKGKYRKKKAQFQWHIQNGMSKDERNQMIDKEEPS